MHGRYLPLSKIMNDKTLKIGRWDHGPMHREFIFIFLKGICKKNAVKSVSWLSLVMSQSCFLDSVIMSSAKSKKALSVFGQLLGK